MEDISSIRIHPKTEALGITMIATWYKAFSPLLTAANHVAFVNLFPVSGWAYIVGVDDSSNKWPGSSVVERPA